MKLDNKQCVLVEFINDKVKDGTHPLGVAYKSWITNTNVDDPQLIQDNIDKGTVAVMKWPKRWPKMVTSAAKLEIFLKTVTFEHPVLILAQGSKCYFIY